MSSITSVDGLVSGLDTTSIVNQLIQVEAQPQTNLKSKLSAQQGVISAYQSVNSKLAALKTAGEALTRSDAWRTPKASASSDAVTATATVGATPGSFTFAVTQLAKAQTSTVALPKTGPVTNGNGLDITVGDTTTHVDIENDTLEGVAATINSKGLGVLATVVNSDQGSFLQLFSAKTGTANAFNVNGLTNALNTLAPAQDAKLTVGDPNAGGYTVSSDSNTFTNVLPNTTITATKVAPEVTVTLAGDSAGMADKMQAMVDAANAALTEITKDTAYNAASKTGQPLSGNLLVRQIASTILSGTANGTSDFGSFAGLGVQLTSDGQLKLDKEKFTAAYEANPAKIQTAVADGLAGTLVGIAKKATNSVDGSITMAIQGGKTTVTRLNDEISAWDTRLADRKTALQKQYAGLEVTLGKLKNQSSWLSSQLAGLSTGS